MAYAFVDECLSEGGLTSFDKNYPVAISSCL